MANFDAINDILKEYYDSSFYYGSNIPTKKLTNAIASYAPSSIALRAIATECLHHSSFNGQLHLASTLFFLKIISKLLCFISALLCQ